MEKKGAAAIAVVGGVAIFLIKMAAYFMSGSVALLSDALESIVNIAASLLMLYAVYVSGMPADDDHHYGHQKIEGISSLIEGAFILTAAVFIIHTAIERIFDPVPLGSVEAALGVSLFATALNGGLSWFLGRNAEAIDSYLESIAIEPNYRAYSNIATVYMAEGRYEEAATNLEAALAIDDTDLRVWLNLCVTFELLPGREADAVAANARVIALAESAVAERPDDGVMLSFLASAYAVAGRAEEAEETVEKALAVAPDDMNVLFHAAGTFERLGDRDRAVELSRRALVAGFPLHMMENETGWRDLTASPEFREMVRKLAPVPDEA